MATGKPERNLWSSSNKILTVLLWHFSELAGETFFEFVFKQFIKLYWDECLKPLTKKNPSKLISGHARHREAQGGGEAEGGWGEVPDVHGEDQRREKEVWNYRNQINNFQTNVFFCEEKYQQPKLKHFNAFFSTRNFKKLIFCYNI